MSTRATIKVIEHRMVKYRIYHHCDGYPEGVGKELKEFFNQAESNLNANKNSEPKYQKYLDRVQVESLFVRYMELKNYSNKYSDSDVTLLVNEFERIANLGNLTQFDNGGKNGATQVKDFINSFR